MDLIYFGKVFFCCVMQGELDGEDEVEGVRAPRFSYIYIYVFFEDPKPSYPPRAGFHLSKQEYLRRAAGHETLSTP